MTQAQIAAKVGGVSTSNIGRWMRGEPGQPGADNVIAFAKAFNRPIGEALAAAGYLGEADVVSKRTPLSEYPTSELFAELQRRTRD
jgi:transcriptional regulator with XRE-family HTH domain